MAITDDIAWGDPITVVADRGQLASLYSDSKYPAKHFIYPNDLPSHGYFALFTPITYERTNKFAPTKRTPKNAIALPIPSQLATAYAPDWGKTELGIVGSAIADEASKIDPANINLEQLKNSIFSDRFIDQINSRIAVNTAQGVAGLINQVTGLNTQAIAGTVFKAAINPHLAMIFTGVDFRTHSFSYRLVARNRQETEAINNIIYTLKYHSMPELGRQFDALNAKLDIFNYPDQWKIEFVTPNQTNNKYLFQPAISVITGLSINYGSDMGQAFFDQTEAPVAVTVSMTFTETEIVHRERIKTDNF